MTNTESQKTIRPEDEQLLADINSDQKIKRDFLALVEKRGYPSISEYMFSVLRSNAARERHAKLKNISAEMFPDDTKSKPSAE